MKSIFTYSVKVHVTVFRHVVVEDNVNSLNVHTTTKQISCNENSLLEVLELLIAVQPENLMIQNQSEQWRNFAGLVIMAPPGSKKSPSSGAPSHRACWGQYAKIRPKNLNK